MQAIRGYAQSTFLLSSLLACSSVTAPPNAAAEDQDQDVTNPVARAASNPSAVSTPTSAPTAQSAKPMAGTIDPAYVCPGFHFALVIHPQAVLTSPLLEMVPERARKGVFTEIERAGLDVKDIEQFMLLASEIPFPRGREDKPGAPPIEPPKFGVVLRFRTPFEPRKLVSKMYRRDVVPKAVHGGESFSDPAGNLPSIFCPDNKTLVASLEAELAQMIGAREGTGSLAAVLRTVGANHDAVAVVENQGAVKELLATAAKVGGQGLPPQLQGVAALPEQFKHAVLTADLAGPSLLTLSIEGNNEEGAKAAEIQSIAGRDFFKEMCARARPEIQKALPAEATGPLLTLIDDLLAGLTVQRTGTNVAIDLKTPAGWKDLPKTLAPVMEQTRRTAATHQRAGNIVQLYVAVMRLQSRGGGLEDIKDNTGKPILSWPVRLLPYLEGPVGGPQEPLDLTKPWDSDYNRKLMAGKMPPHFGTSKEGLTSIFMFSRDGKLLPMYMTGQDAGKIAIVEAGADKAVPWTKPEDLPVVDDNPASVLGTLPSGKFLAVFFDGHVEDVDAKMEPARLLAMILPLRLPKKADNAAPAREEGAKGAAVKLDPEMVSALQQLHGAVKQTMRLLPKNPLYGSDWRQRLSPFLEETEKAFGVDNQGRTATFIFTGPGTLFGEKNADGLNAEQSARKILFVVAGRDKAVPFKNPTDLPLDSINPVAALGTLPDGKFAAIFFDGHIEMIDAKIEPAKLVEMIGPDEATAAPADGNGGTTTGGAAKPPAAPIVPALRAPGQLRTWTDVVGRKIEAKLLGLEMDNVRLEKKDGTPLSVPLSRLRQEDQEYVKGLEK